MEDYKYLMGLIDFGREDLRLVLEAISYFRSKDIVVSVSTYTDKGDSLRLPIGLRCRPGATSEVKDMFERALDTCGVIWKEINPSIASEGSLRAVRAIDSARDAADITVDEVTPPCEIGDAFEGLVGRDDEISLVRDVALAAKAYGRDSLESLHIALLGNPGVGKTEFAQRIAKHYRKHGVITGRFHKVSAADLIYDHVGSAPRLVRSAFDRAQDGILFIDEAYSLTQGDGNEFGVEAVNALVECMDSRRDEVIVIAAGYFREMNEFLSSNPGLRERFGFEIKIKDYSASELGGIYREFAKAKDFAIDKGLDEEAIASRCGKLMKMEGFAGARTIRKAFTESVLSAAVRHPESRSIAVDDLNTAVNSMYSKVTERRSVGFA